MKKIFLILLVLLLFGCTETVYKTVEGNLVPIIELSPRIETITDQQQVTFTVEIIDDDSEHDIVWLLDGEEILTEPEYIYTASLAVRTNHNVGVIVSDGELISMDSVNFIVTEIPWSAEPLKIYIFEVGTIPHENNIVRIYTATDADDYLNRLVSAVRTVIEIHNRDYDPDWYSVGGGT